MRHKLIFTLLLSTLSHYIYSQNNRPEVYLNHLFIVLDSISYKKLSDSSLITKKLGDLKFSSTATAEDSWSGKYFYGRNGYFEFFSKDSYKGARLGDCGFGFMTKKANDIFLVEANWKARTQDSVVKDTSFQMFQGVRQPWFYSLGLYSNDSLHVANAWLMENTKQHLISVGFSSEEIIKEISGEDYTAKKNKRNSNKSFDRINAIHLVLSNKNYDYLKATLLGFGFQEKGNAFLNSRITVRYTLNESHPIRLLAVETELTESFDDHTIMISDDLKVHIKGKKALWAFRYKENE